MNKLLIILLAVCLVSVHGFVKRDAPETSTSQDDLAKQIQKGVEDILKQFSETVNPDTIKAGLNQIVDKISDVTKNINKPSGAPQQ